ncbi:fibropellin-1-like [Anneissia japonica]|uniref:fibropellin-1-like n=1 Tax=Anneissia japonica TaxID=1529436 RepID=UPI001425941C|nr:fibropellin-1-like [Anneissia japonica]
MNITLSISPGPLVLKTNDLHLKYSCSCYAKGYLLNYENYELKIDDGRLEFKVNSSSLFNDNCPLAFKFIDTFTDEVKTVNVYNGVASTSNIERGKYKMRFILDGMLGRKFPNYFSDIKVTFKGMCLSFPCRDSSICQQHEEKTYKCSCPPGQILKGIECYNEYPCIDNPCGNGVCTRIETSTSVHHDCTCYRGFYKAHSTCLRDPCNDNPCGRNYECKVIELDSGIRHICDCNPGFFVTTDLTCEFDPCFNNLCGNGTCDRIKTDSGIERICQCYDGFYNFENTCKPNPCLNNPCMNGIGICIINEAVECNYECSCFTGFYATKDTCRPDPCFNIPCGVDRGICERNEDSGHNCRCFERFRLVENTCLIDPCYNNPCGNGTCTIIANSSHSCDCYPGYEAVNDTCNRNYCFDNPCRPGNCTVKDNSFTCNCPSSYQLIDGKCLEKESIVMHAVVGLAGGLTGLFLILVFFYVKKCCPPHIDDPELKKVSSFDKLMLEDLKSRTSTGSSLAPSSSEHFSEQTTISFTNGQPLQPISCSSKYPPDSNGVLTSTYPYNHCHETCRLPCRIHQPRFQENWPRAEDIQHYPHSEEETFNWQTQVQYPRYISIDSQPSTSNHASVEYCTDRESSL